MKTGQDWIGPEWRTEEQITPRQISEFRATLGALHCAGDELPGLQWCLCPEILEPGQLGRDGHPKKGLVLPDLGLARRMWAGGQINWRGGIASGESISRTTSVRDVSFKEGRSGRLGFVTLAHRYSCAEELRIEEIQNIVYREDPAYGATPIQPPQAEAWPEAESRPAQTSPTLLFRYSAMTFNGHRIHYDHPYATRVEGYAGLVVHGPLQATWMQHLARDMLGRVPAEFAYRGLSPLICDRPAMIEARANSGGVELRVRDIEANVITMSATAN
ncbi:MAG: FAS1-like dehydratase domain-containing protein [Paracoccaceae bacterium]